MRQKVNAWILSSGEFDAVVDLDAVLRDPGHPTRLLPSYDSGDHLHPNNLGYVAAGNAIPLALFESPVPHPPAKPKGRLRTSPVSHSE